MNKQSAVLLSILSRSLPNDQELARISNMQTILHSDAYLELSKRKIFDKLFREYYSEEKLTSYSDKELDSAAKALPYVPQMLEDLVFSLKNGAAPQLTAQDKPDFLDKKSVQALSEKLKDGNGKNYTNIDAEDFMDIFDGNTVKDIHNDYYDLPTDCGDYNVAIKALYPGKKYCISAEEVSNKEKEYNDKLETINQHIENGKKSRRNRVLARLAIALFCLLLPTVFAGLTGALSATSLAVCSVIEIILSIVFFIRG